jgi:ParB/RepB/Spo0J family partition protein
MDTSTTTQHKYGYRYAELPIEQVARDVNQPRKDFGTDGDTNRLLVSIKQYGIETPIVVSEQEPGYFLIVDGHRRFICAQKLGYTHIPCRIYPRLGDGELETRRYEIQNNRRPWRPLERSEALERIKNAHSFTSNVQLAEHLGISEAIVANSMQLHKQKFSHLELMKEYGLTESYMNEFVRLKPKLRKVQQWEVDDIIINIFERIKHNVIANSKELRKLGSIFQRATLNEEALARYLADDDMKISELQQAAEQSLFALNVENVIRTVTEKRSQGIAFKTQERAFLEQLRDLLNEAV